MIWDTWEGWTLRWQHVRGSNTMYRTSSSIMPLIWKLEPQIQNAEWGSNGLSKWIRSSQRFCGLRLTVTRKPSTVSCGCSRWRGVLGSLVMSMAVGGGRESIILAVSHTRAGSLSSVQEFENEMWTQWKHIRTVGWHDTSMKPQLRRKDWWEVRCVSQNTSRPGDTR